MVQTCTDQGAGFRGCGWWFGKSYRDPFHTDHRVSGGSKFEAWQEVSLCLAIGLMSFKLCIPLRCWLCWNEWPNSSKGHAQFVVQLVTLRRMMLDMGYEESAARSALRRSSSVDDAIDLIAAQDAKEWLPCWAVQLKDGKIPRFQKNTIWYSNIIRWTLDIDDTFFQMSRGFRRRCKYGWNEETETSCRSNQKRAGQAWCFDVQSYSTWFHMISYDFI